MTDFEKDLLERMGELNEADLELLFDDSCWGEDVPALDSKTVKRIQKKTYQKLNKKLTSPAVGKWVAVAACFASLLLVWQKDTVYAQLQKWFHFLPGVGIVAEEEDTEMQPWYYTIVLEDDSEIIAGWEVILEKGYISRQRESEYNKGKGDFVLKFSAEKREEYGSPLEHMEQLEIYCDGERLSNGGEHIAKWRHLEEASRGNGVIQMYGVWMNEFSPGKTYELRLSESGLTVFTFSVEELLGAALTEQSSKGGGNTLLAVEEERTEDGLKVYYYPYYEENEIVLQIPSPLRFTKTEESYFVYDMGRQVVPYLTDGTNMYPAVSAGMQEQDYNDITQSVFDAPKGKEYTLHVPYMVAQEQRYDLETEKWISSMERSFEDEANIIKLPKLEIGETVPLSYKKDFNKAAVEFTSVTRITLEEMKTLAGIDYGENVHGYYFALDVENQNGWELLWFNFALDGSFYGYYFIPHLESGKLEGFMMLIGEQAWESVGTDELKMVIGNPGYLIETDFVIDGIVE